MSNERWVGAVCFAGGALWFVLVASVSFLFKRPAGTPPLTESSSLLPALALWTGVILVASGIGGLTAPVLHGHKTGTKWGTRALIGGIAYGVLFGGYGMALFGGGMAEEVLSTHVASAVVVATAYGAPAILFGAGAALLTSWLSNRLPLARRKRIGAGCFSASAFLASLTLSVVVDVKGPGIYRMMTFWVPFPAAVYGLLAPEYVVEDEAWSGWLDRIWVGAMGAFVSGAIIGPCLYIAWWPTGIAAGIFLDDPVEFVGVLCYGILFGVLASLPAVPFGIGAAALTSWLSDG